MSTIQDTDLLLVHRGGEDYKITALKLKEELNQEPGLPWVGHDGGIWHVKNANQEVKFYGGPYQAWTVDGVDVGSIPSINPGQEFVFVTGRAVKGLFATGAGWNGARQKNATWDFGEHTDTSKVTSFNHLFMDCEKFNGTLDGNWDTSNVTDMYRMFFWCKYFRGLSPMNWNTSKVTDMKEMFCNATYFTNDLSGWDTSNVTNMHKMFESCRQFESDLSGWNTSKVKDMFKMFDANEMFDSDIGGWDVSKVTDMKYMLEFCVKFNQDLSGWCVAHLTTEPTNFSWNTSSWVKPKPDWGTCPRGENQ